MNLSCIVFSLSIAACAWLCACSSTPPNPNPRAAQPLTLAPAIDLNRFMGRWYVIANIPYFAERGFVGSYAEYSLQPDGGIEDLYFGRKKNFDAPIEKHALKDKVVPGTGNAEWSASPFWPLTYNFMILYVDPDYQLALLGYPNKQLGWVYARSPTISDAAYAELLIKMDQQGYDTSRIQRIPQQAGQIGQPGFQAQ